MPTDAQISANQRNAQFSTGPKTDAGKAASSQNNFRHGFCGAFRVLDWEEQDQYDGLLADLNDEHLPTTITETILIEKMAQHLWLARRAQHIQDTSVDDELGFQDRYRRFGVILRYKNLNDRGFLACLNQLLKLRAEKRKAEIGFEREQRREAEEARRAEREIRAQQMHPAKLALLEARVERQESKKSRPQPEKTHRPDPAKRILPDENAA
jgi:hypothetical protein